MLTKLEPARIASRHLPAWKRTCYFCKQPFPAKQIGNKRKTLSTGKVIYYHAECNPQEQKMKEQHIAILQLLNSSDKPLTRTQIFEQLEPNEQGLFTKGVDSLSKELDVLKSKRGMLKNGHPTIVSNRSMTTWELNDVGKAMADKLDKKSPATTTATESASTHATAQAEAQLPTPELNQPEKTMDTNQAETQLLIDAAKLLQELAQKPVPKPIENVNEKIAVLQHFIKFTQPINPDFAEILNDISNDLQQAA